MEFLLLTLLLLLLLYYLTLSFLFNFRLQFLSPEKKKVEDHNSSVLATNDLDQSEKVEKLSTESAKVSACGDVDNASGHEIGSSEAAKEDNDLNSGARCGVTPDGRSDFFTGESPSCSKSKLDVDKHEDSASARE